MKGSSAASASRGHRLNRVRSSAIAIGVLGLAAALATPVSSAGATSNSSKAKKGFTIAYISQGTSNSWAAQIDAVVNATAQKSGVVKKLVYFNGEGSATTQLPLISTAVAEHPDAIVLIPLGSSADVGPVERAMAEKIPVVLCASTIASNNYTSIVNVNYAKAALPLANWLMDEMHHKGNLLDIGGLAGNATTLDYDNALNTALKKNPNVHVVYKADASYSISTAKQLASTAIASGKQINGAWGDGGEAVTGIEQAYIDSKVRPIPPIAGGAATNGIIRLAVQNNIPSAMLQFPAAMGKLCLTDAINVLQGKKVPKVIDVSALPQYADIFSPNLTKFFNPKYTDDYYLGTNSVLTTSQLAAINLTK